MRGDAAAADPAYKLFDEHGDVLALRSDMTIPIARVVASRYPSAEPPLRFCYFAHAYRSVQPQRGQPREMLQAGIELVGAPGPEGTAEALTVLCEALEAAGLENWRIGLGDASLYPRLLDRARRAGGRAGADPARARHARLRRPGARGGGASARRSCSSCPSAAAAPRCSTRPRPSRWPALHAMLPEAVAGRIIFDLGLTRAALATTRARCSRSTTPRSGTPIGGGGRYDDLLGRFGRSLPACGWALDVERLHAARGGGGPMSALTDRGPARRAAAATRSTCSTGSGSTPPRCARNDRKLLFEDAGLVTMRPSDVPTYVEAGAADLGITGKDVLAEHPERDVYELLDLGFGPCRMVFATVAGEDRAAEALRRLGVMRIATKYPRIAGRLLRAHGPPGRDRRGQGLRRARAADRARARDRRPHRDRHDAARERPRDPRGDRGLDGAADRQPGRPQAQGGGDRRRRRADPWRGVAARVGERGGARRARSRAGRARPADVGRRATCARSSPPCAPAATRALLELERRFGGGEQPLRVHAGRAGGRAGGARPRRPRRAGGRDRERARRSPRRASTPRPRRSCPRATRCGCARCRSRARRSTSRRGATRTRRPS